MRKIRWSIVTLAWFKFETDYVEDFILTSEADVYILACITVAGQSEKHVKTVIKQTFSFMSDKQVVLSSNSIKIHYVKLGGSTKFSEIV